MLKKILFALLASAMVLSAAACGSKNKENTDNTGDTAVTDGADTSAPEESDTEASAVYEGTLEELVDAIYEKRPMEAMMGPATQIDLTDADAMNYYLGISDAAGIKEAVFSEPMIGSIPYSLCLVRVEEGADTAALMQSIFDGVDMVKWMCVNTDTMIVANHADVILMVMNNAEEQGEISAEMYEAFAEIVGGEGTKLEK